MNAIFTNKRREPFGGAPDPATHLAELNARVAELEAAQWKEIERGVAFALGSDAVSVPIFEAKAPVLVALLRAMKAIKPDDYKFLAMHLPNPLAEPLIDMEGYASKETYYEECAIYVEDEAAELDALVFDANMLVLFAALRALFVFDHPEYCKFYKGMFKSNDSSDDVYSAITRGCDSSDGDYA